MKFILVWLAVLKFAIGSTRVSVQLPYSNPAGVTYVEGKASSDLVAGPSQRVLAENISVRSLDTENRQTDRSGRYEITEDFETHDHNGQYSTPTPMTSIFGKAARILHASSYGSFPSSSIPSSSVPGTFHSSSVPGAFHSSSVPGTFHSSSVPGTFHSSSIPSSSHPQPQPPLPPKPHPQPEPHPYPVHPYPDPHLHHVQEEVPYNLVQRPSTIATIREQPYSQQVDASADASADARAASVDASPAPLEDASPAPTIYRAPGSPPPRPGYPIPPIPRFPNSGYNPGPHFATPVKPGTAPPGAYIPRTPVTPPFKSKPSGIPPIFYYGGAIPYQPIFPIATPTLYPQPEIVTVQQPGYVTLQSPTVSLIPGSHAIPTYGHHSLPVTRADDHSNEQSVTKTIDVAQPAIKTSRYEVRRPAIQKQFYDIEERIIIRPAGTVVVELDHPISKTPKGETIQEVGGHYTGIADSAHHGQLNLEIGTPSQHGIISQPTNQQEGYDTVDSSNQQLQSTTTTIAPSTQDPFIATTTTNPQDDDTIVVEARTDIPQLRRANQSNNIPAIPAPRNIVRYQVGDPTRNTACTIACQQQRDNIHKELLSRRGMVFYQQPQSTQYFRQSQQQDERLGQFRQESSTPVAPIIRQQYDLRTQENDSQRQQFGQLRQENPTPITPQIRQQFNMLRTQEDEQLQQRVGQLRQQYDFQAQEDEQPRLDQIRQESPRIAQFRQQYNAFRSEQQAFPAQQQQYRARQQVFRNQQQDEEVQAHVVEVKQDDPAFLQRSAAQKTTMPFMISVGEADVRYPPYSDASPEPISRSNMKSAYTQESTQQEEQPLQQFRQSQGEQTIQQPQQFVPQPRPFQPRIISQQRQEQNDVRPSILPSPTPQLLRTPQISSQFGTNAALVEKQSSENQRKYISLLLGQGGVSEVSGALTAEGPTSGYLRSRVISATPAPYDAQPVDDRVKTRRIVISQPLETVQEVEVQEPVTKFQRLAIKQPIGTKSTAPAPPPAPLFSRSTSPFVRPLPLDSQKNN